jgi:hypothetical protein
MKPNPVVVVPGLMGSELSFEGSLVWQRSLRALRSILNPAFFMPWLPLRPERADLRAV